MSEMNYVLKRVWQSKSGVQEFLYLGYNDNGKMDCVANIEKAKRMTEEECEQWLLVVAGKKFWSIEKLEDTQNDLENKTDLDESQKEKENEQDS